MKIAIMQPYFCAYIGYYQLINSVDKFVICNNMQYTKRGWFNRNRILDNGNIKVFTIPLKKYKRDTNVNLRFLADNSIRERIIILKQIQNFYQKAPFYSQNYPFIESLFLQKNENLFNFIYDSVIKMCSILNIKTQIILSSSLDINHELKSQDRIVEMCKYLKTDIYINPIGGKELYNKEVFKEEGIELRYIKSKKIEYAQFDHAFVPWLSIIDVLMFNEIEKVKSYLNEYELE
jgi:hypothetical protein